MRVIYSTGSVVQYDGYHYYNSAVQATYKRYLSLGDEIVVICYKQDVEIPSGERIDEDNVSFVFVNKINTIKKLFSDLRIQNEEIVKREVENADYCVAHIPCPHSYKVIKYSKIFNKPCLDIVVGCPWDSMWNYSWKGKLLAPIEYFTLRKIQLNASYSIYVTNKFLQERYPTKGKSIGCSNVNFTTGIKDVLNNRLLNIENRLNNKRRFIVGTAAAIDVPYKGQEYVIKALARLKREGLFFDYYLIGDGNSDRLKKIAQKEDVIDQVYFMGALPHKEVTSFYDNIDVYIQPSKQEGLPRATIEAMSRGCLCLGSKIAGIPELLDSDFLFPKGNVLCIAELLKKVDFNLLREQAKVNFEKAREYDCDLLNKKREGFISMFKIDTLKNE